MFRKTSLKTAFLFCFLLCAASFARAPSGVELEGYVSLWVQDCSSGDCGLPAPLETNLPVKLVLGVPSGPGGAVVEKTKKIFSLEEGKLDVTITFFSLYPPGAPVFYQVQAQLEGLAESFCSVSLNREDFYPFPVLACAGYRGKDRIGITLHRNKLKKEER